MATHNHVLAMAKGGIQTILEMDWPSSDEDDGDFAEGSDDDNDAGAAKGKAREGDADVEPKKKSRRVRIPPFTLFHIAHVAAINTVSYRSAGYFRFCHSVLPV